MQARLGPAARLRPVHLFAGPLVALFGALAGCGGSGTDRPFTVPEGCNPLAAEAHCALPFPSDFFLIPDEALPSGFRVELPDAAAIVRETDGVTVDLFDSARADGFSPGSTILAYFPEAIDGEPLVGFGEPLAPPAEVAAARTVLLDAETGTPVPHVAELDTHAIVTTQQAVVLRPLVRLDFGKRYVVAIQGLTTTGGDPVAAPEGFRRLREGKAGGVEALEGLAARYDEDVFPVLEAAGLARGDLQLAWDFTVRTKENATGDLEAVRAAVLAAFEDTPPTVTIEDVTDYDTGPRFRLVEATMTVPLFVDSAEPGARVLRDDEGRVISSGTAEVPFVALIPRSVGEADAEAPPARLLQYGHGIFGSTDEVTEDGSWIPAFADEYGFVVVAADWWGMSGADLTVVLDRLGNTPSDTMQFLDRARQAMANQLALGEAATRVLPALEEFRANDAPVFDPEVLYFHGNSLGHIFGSTYVGLSPRITRAALGVGGANFAHFIARSGSFGTFFIALDESYASPLDVQFFLAQTQVAFDAIDPMNFAPAVYDPYEGDVTRTYLLQLGIGDTTVPNIATYFHARLLGAKLLGPSAGTAPLLEIADAPHAEATLVTYDFGLEDGTLATPEPAATNPIHNAVRVNGAAQAQIDAFLRPAGTVDWFCEAPCAFELD